MNPIQPGMFQHVRRTLEKIADAELAGSPSVAEGLQSDLYAEVINALAADSDSADQFWGIGLVCLAQTSALIRRSAAPPTVTPAAASSESQKKVSA